MANRSRVTDNMAKQRVGVTEQCLSPRFIISFLLLPSSHSILGVRKKCIHSPVRLNHSEKKNIHSPVRLFQFEKNLHLFSLSTDPFRTACLAVSYPFTCHGFSGSNGYCKERFCVRGHIGHFPFDQKFRKFQVGKQMEQTFSRVSFRNFGCTSRSWPKIPVNQNKRKILFHSTIPACAQFLRAWKLNSTWLPILLLNISVPLVVM